MQLFEGRDQNKCLLKLFLVHAPQNDGPVKCSWNWKEINYFQTSRISNIWFNEIP